MKKILIFIINFSFLKLLRNLFFLPMILFSFFIVYITFIVCLPKEIDAYYILRISWDFIMFDICNSWFFIVFNVFLWGLTYFLFICL